VQDEILDDIRTVLSSTAGVDPAEVTSDKSFTDDLGVDSMTMLDAIVALEDRFGVLIPDDEWARFSTVGDLVAHLRHVGVGATA
jgi:acyl carrier protein